MQASLPGADARTGHVGIPGHHRPRRAHATLVDRDPALPARADDLVLPVALLSQETPFQIGCRGDRTARERSYKLVSPGNATPEQMPAQVADSGGGREAEVTIPLVYVNMGGR
jgi:hypothetical protein